MMKNPLVSSRECDWSGESTMYHCQKPALKEIHINFSGIIHTR